jgi:hypothetical protein
MGGLDCTAHLLVLATSLAAPEGVPPHAKVATESPSEPTASDPTAGQPFLWHELLRLDVRPSSPTTDRTFLVSPVVPLPVGPHRAAVLALYRHDALATGLLDASGGVPAGMHRFEFGVPASFRLSGRFAFDADLRLVHGSDLGPSAHGGWFPWLRAGLSWRPGPDLTLGASVLWTRGALGLVPVPIFSMYWRPRNLPWRFDTLAPRYAEVAYRAHPRIELFSTFHWETLVWAVDDPSGADGAHLMRQEIRLHGGARVALWGPLGVEASAQWVPWQRVELSTGSGQNFANLDDLAVTLSVVVQKPTDSEDRP